MGDDLDVEKMLEESLNKVPVHFTSEFLLRRGLGAKY